VTVNIEFFFRICECTDIEDPFVFFATTEPTAAWIGRVERASKSTLTRQTGLFIEKAYVFLTASFSDNSRRNVGKNLRECQM
jgi:hypothetical protein